VGAYGPSRMFATRCCMAESSAFNFAILTSRESTRSSSCMMVLASPWLQHSA
jgi:hypothetical protein